MKKTFYCLFAVLSLSICLSDIKADCLSECYEKNQCYQMDSNGIIHGVEIGCEKSCKSICESENLTYNKIQCGDFDVPYVAAQITSTFIFILEIITPIIIIILGSVDLLKAVMAQKEDEIKKGQQVFIRRLIMGCLVFLTFVIVKFVIGLVSPDDEYPNMWSCVDCFINNDCTLK